MYTGIAYRHCCDKIEIIKKIRKISFFYSLFRVGEKSGDFRIEFFGRAKNRAILAIFWAILTKSIWSHWSVVKDFPLSKFLVGYLRVVSRVSGKFGL